MAEHGTDLLLADSDKRLPTGDGLMRMSYVSYQSGKRLIFFAMNNGKWNASVPTGGQPRDVLMPRPLQKQKTELGPM